MADAARPNRLDRAVDTAQDHVLGDENAEITLVEYGSYACPHCRTAHEMIRHLRERFGDQMRYVYRHLPLADRHEATLAAELAEYAAATTGDFWTTHDALMRRGPVHDDSLRELAVELGVPPIEPRDATVASAAARRVRLDARSGLRSGALVAPTFFINGRRYEGAWDEVALSEAMLRSLGHRVHAASLDFARWGPSTGLLLLLATLTALGLSNSPLGAGFRAFWEMPVGIQVGGRGFALSVLDWINHGFLSVFFLVVGLEIKRELTVGHLATLRAAAFPIAGAVGGVVVPAIIYLLVAPAAFRHVWGATIATDAAFAVALIVLMGSRVPVELRVFLTAAVIADDLVAIAVVAIFYSGALDMTWLLGAVAVTGVLIVLSRSQVYRTLPYALLGMVLWLALHEGGLHATLAGVILAAVTPTRPPPNLSRLAAQAQAVINAETRSRGEAVMQTGPSEQALHALDAIHDRIESPASKLLRAVEPWSSYLVLPVFALANAGLVWSTGVVEGHGRLIAAIVLALVGGKLVGILAAARLSVRLGVATKPAAYTWRQVAGAGALGGIGFTMSLFIAGQAVSGRDYAAVKVAIFLASLLAGGVGAAILWGAPGAVEGEADGGQEELEVGTPAGGWASGQPDG